MNLQKSSQVISLVDVFHIDRQITLMLKAEQISETSVFNSTLTWLITQARFNALKFINLIRILLIQFASYIHLSGERLTEREVGRGPFSPDFIS
jgi:hypothetical protein